MHQPTFMWAKPARIALPRAASTPRRLGGRCWARIAARSGRLVLALALALGWAAAPAAAEIRVAATIKPVHSLVAAVMGAAGAPDLVLSGSASPHMAALRPSQARMITQADVVFAVGKGLEPFLDRLVEARGDEVRLVELAEADGVRLLSYRSPDEEDHDHADDDVAAHGDHEHGAIDPHIWLDPDNAKAMARRIAGVLSRADPANSELYRANAQALAERLDALTAEIAARLEPVRNRPFLAFHDAYHYFEARFGLSGLGGIVLSPETPPGARRLKQVRDRIAEAAVVCVFAEPQFDSGYVRTVTEGSDVGTASLDYLGVGVEPGPDAYRRILLDLTEALTGCLSRS